MSTLIYDTHQVLAFTGTFTRPDVIKDLATYLTGQEVQATAGLLDAFGEPAAAQAWVAVHARAEKVAGDDRQRAQDQYIVPVDPMDDLQCDSCQ